MISSEDPEYDFAQRLDRLFRTHVKPDGSEYSYEEVQNGTGKAVTAAYIWRLRTGRATNPGLGVIMAISHFFGIDPGYFVHDDSAEARKMVESHANVDLAARLGDDAVKNIALRASELDEAGKQALLSMIDYILQTKK